MLSYHVFAFSPHIALVGLTVALVGFSFILAGAGHFMVNLLGGLHRCGDFLYTSVEARTIRSWTRHRDVGLVLIGSAALMVTPYALEACFLFVALGAMCAAIAGILESLNPGELEDA